MALHILSRKFFCQDCQYTWPKQQCVEPEEDELGWPRESKLWHPKRSRPRSAARNAD